MANFVFGLVPTSPSLSFRHRPGFNKSRRVFERAKGMSQALPKPSSVAGANASRAAWCTKTLTSTLHKTATLKTSHQTMSFQVFDFIIQYFSEQVPSAVLFVLGVFGGLSLPVISPYGGWQAVRAWQEFRCNASLSFLFFLVLAALTGVLCMVG